MATISVVQEASMRMISLKSGSNGNCIYIEAAGVKLLIDAGISGLQAQHRLAQFGVHITDVDALLISHDHSDHTRSMGIFQRRFQLPIHCTQKTYAAASKRCQIGPLRDVFHFVAGETLQFGDVRVETIRTPHDAVDGVCFVVDDGRRRLGVLTDLGHVFDGLADVVRSLDGVLIESNYDAEMLATGPYPWFLQQRIRGPGGHLSNADCAGVLAQCDDRLRWACIGHLSEHNNQPETALATHRQVHGARWPLTVASRYEPTAVLEVA
jgi:phosphoribosyl 1,2-cyclic phosphodiesterase